MFFADTDDRSTLLAHVHLGDLPSSGIAIVQSRWPLSPNRERPLFELLGQQAEHLSLRRQRDR